MSPSEESNLSVSRLRDLLGLAVEAEKVSRSSLPAELRASPHALERLDRLLQELAPWAESTPSLEGKQASVEALRNLKNATKRSFEGSGDSRERASLRLLYHASIAAAYGRHGAKISSLSLTSSSELHEDLAVLLRDHPLGAVFRKAVNRFRAEESARDSD